MPRNVAVIGHKKELIVKFLDRCGLVLNDKNPEIVIAIGGDGTFLFSEQVYPGIPKVFIKHTQECSTCFNHDFSNILNAVVKNEYIIKKETKIVAEVQGKKLIGLNEINIHYTPPRAIRLILEVNNELIAKEIIGDGLVVSTPYGSSGYYKSITGKDFFKGLGIAFNNPTIKMDSLILPENSVIRVRVIRECGVVTVDCNKDVISLRPGDVVTIKRHSEEAKIAVLKGRTEKILRY